MQLLSLHPPPSSHLINPFFQYLLPLHVRSSSTSPWRCMFISHLVKVVTITCHRFSGQSYENNPSALMSFDIVDSYRLPSAKIYRSSMLCNQSSSIISGVTDFSEWMMDFFLVCGPLTFLLMWYVKLKAHKLSDVGAQIQPLNLLNCSPDFFIFWVNLSLTLMFYATIRLNQPGLEILTTYLPDKNQIDPNRFRILGPMLIPGRK